MMMTKEGNHDVRVANAMNAEKKSNEKVLLTKILE